MKTVTVHLGLLVALLYSVGTVHAQQIAECQGSNSIQELEESIRTHNEHIYRLNRKFLEYWYFQGKVPDDVLLKGTLTDVERFLEEIPRRRTAVLFYGHQAPKFCIWMIWLDSGRDNRIQQLATLGNIESSGHLSVLQVVNEFDDQSFGSFDAIRSGMQNRGLAASTSTISLIDVDDTLLHARDILLPIRVAEALELLDIDTLVIVPITIQKKDEQFASIGTVPFGALPFRGEQLIDRMSVVVAPGFYAFREAPRSPRKTFTDAVIVGDPNGDLSGARQEAKAIAKYLNATLLLGAEATVAELRANVDMQHAVDFLHFATHGIADEENPLDESYLLMAGNEKLTARQISHLKLPNQPIVVMSACQTGHGKDFGVGTIGLARSWQWAGASSVIMSLWDVDDAATRNLMQLFVRLARRLPVDKALQQAMRTVRQDNPSPHLWAGFSVFGMPETNSGATSSSQASLTSCGNQNSTGEVPR